MSSRARGRSTLSVRPSPTPGRGRRRRGPGIVHDTGGCGADRGHETTARTSESSGRVSQYRCRSLRHVRAIRRFTVRTVLPEPLAPLGELVMNLRWSWHPRPTTCSPRSTPSLGRRRPRPGAAARRGRRRAAGRARRRRRLPARALDDAARRPARVPDRAALVPAARHGPRAGRDRLLLARVRHHRRAAAVLRRPRHPRRRPPQGGQRPRRADHRRRPALPAAATSSSRCPARAGSRRHYPVARPATGCR